MLLGTVPVEEFQVETTVARPGRTVELVEARMIHDGRPAVILRAWLMKTRDTDTLAGTSLPAIPGPAEMPAWDPAKVWPGGFIASAEVRRIEREPGRAQYWVRTPVSLLREEASPTARAAGLFDIANGMTVRVDPAEVAFPNVDLTAHLFRQPAEGWLGFDTTVSFGATGLGLTHSIVHDEAGPFGSVSQPLTLRP